MGEESPAAISIADRASAIAPRPGRHASVALPVLRHAAYGPVLAVTQRATVNGHTGARISHAGDVVLFGGSRDPGEDGAAAAVRELREEAGLPERVQCRVVARVGEWVTERGYAAEGYLVAADSSFAAVMAPDAREVARVGFLRLGSIFASPVSLEYHAVAAADRWPATPHTALVESPTLRVLDAERGENWLLWGLAGHMVAALIERYRTAAELVAAARI